MLMAARREMIPPGAAVSTDENAVETEEGKSKKRWRQLGWVAVMFFTLKGLLWLALGAGAWKWLTSS
jgi:hypothetical protein